MENEIRKIDSNWGVLPYPIVSDKKPSDLGKVLREENPYPLTVKIAASQNLSGKVLSTSEKLRRATQNFLQIWFGVSELKTSEMRVMLKHEGEVVGKRLREEKWIEHYGGTKKDLKEWFKSDTNLSYPEYLQEKYGDEIPGVKYMTEEERNKCEVEFKGGKFYVDGKPLQTQEKGEMLFVINPQGQTFVTEGIEGKLHHSSPLSGRPILSGGDIETDENGHLKRIRIKSGHYQTGQKEGIYAMKNWMAKGISLRDVTVSEKIHIGHEGASISTHYAVDAAEYYDKKGNVLPDSLSIKTKEGKKKITVTAVGKDGYLLSEPNSLADQFLATKGFKNVLA